MLFLLGLDNSERMSGHVFNVGDERQNCTKPHICENIRARLADTYIHYADVGKDADQRNYFLSYAKLNRLGYSTQKTVDEGIDELARALQVVQVRSPYANV